jgi:hypothetical protein
MILGRGLGQRSWKFSPDDANSCSSEESDDTNSVMVYADLLLELLYPNSQGSTFKFSVGKDLLVSWPIML